MLLCRMVRVLRVCVMVCKVKERSVSRACASDFSFWARWEVMRWVRLSIIIISMPESCSFPGWGEGGRGMASSGVSSSSLSSISVGFFSAGGFADGSRHDGRKSESLCGLPCRLTSPSTSQRPSISNTRLMATISRHRWTSFFASSSGTACVWPAPEIA